MAEKEKILRIKLLGDKESQDKIVRLGKEVRTLTRLRQRLDKQEKNGLVTLKQAALRRTELNTKIKVARTNLSALTRQQLLANGAIKKGTGLSKSISKEFASMALRIGGATAAFLLIKNAVVGAFNIMKDFQQANADLAAILGKTRAEITQLTDDSKRLGGTTKFTATEVSKLQKEYAKLGFSTQEILNATEATLDLAAATGTDLAEAATVVGATVRGFGLDASETQRVVDVMAKSFSSSALDMEKFKVSMSKIAPVAKAVGLTIEEVTGFMGTLADSGIEASTIGTSLRKVFIELSRKGLTLEDALDQIKNSTDKLKKSTELFGIKAATTGLILAENTEQAAELTKKLNDAGGAAKRMAKEQLNTLQGSLIELTSAYEGFILGIEDGEGVIADNIKALIDWTTTLFQSEKQSKETRAFVNLLRVAWFGLTKGIELAILPLKLVIKFFLRLGKIIGTALAPVIENVIIPAFEKLDRIIVDIGNSIISLINTITQSGLVNKISSVLGIEISKIDRLLTESTKKFVENQAKERAAKLEAFRFLIEKDKEKVRAAIKIGTDLEDLQDEFTKKKIKAIEKEEERITKLKLKNAQLRLQIASARSQKELERIAADFDAIGKDSQKRLSLLLSDALNRGKIRLLEAETIDEEKEAKIEIENARFQQQLTTLGSQQSAIELATKEHNQNLRAIDDKTRRAKIDNAQQFLTAASTFVDALSSIQQRAKAKELSAAGDNAKKREEIEKKFAKKEQTIAISQAVIRGAMAVMRIAADVPKADYGIATALLIAAQIASTLGQIAIISSHTFARGGIAETGGILKGASHAQGGIPFTVGGISGFEAQGGEPILTKGVGENPHLRAAASALNVAAGGVAFDKVGRVPIHKFRHGAITPVSPFSAINTAQGIQQIFTPEDIAAALADTINDLKVTNVVTQTTEGQKSVANVVSEATIG